MRRLFRRARSGLLRVYLYQTGRPAWQPLTLVSLVLTLCAGLQTISFWAIRFDFDPAWWLPNLFLLVYPLFFIPRLAVENKSI